jgi:histidyl-tRNA synthetase
MEMSELLSEPKLLELFKLSHLSRLPGLKKVRCRLFYEAGLDTLASIAALEPAEVHEILQGFIERTGFEGVAPTLGEAEITVAMARFLPENLT